MVLSCTDLPDANHSPEQFRADQQIYIRGPIKLQIRHPVVMKFAWKPESNKARAILLFLFSSMTYINAVERKTSDVPSPTEPRAVNAVAPPGPAVRSPSTDITADPPVPESPDCPRLSDNIE
ncbi:hypothetical protein PUN28_020628 [Cardiocondyla obscurior]|uniref:Uncharacterized protein n=1 Tax=Cardiocondyla obscurior TaxID=286306 RepID=A0AAW2E5X2_9HYME